MVVSKHAAFWRFFGAVAMQEPKHYFEGLLIMATHSYMPTVSIIIPVFKDWERARLCLRALEAQSFPKEECEVIVVNNDMEHPVPNDILGLAVKVVTEEKAGSYAARNLGIAQAKGSVLAFTDSDCFPDPQWIAMGVCALKNGADLVAGKVAIKCEEGTSFFARAYEKAFAFDQRANVKKNASVTANLIVNRDAFYQAGLFDSTLLSGGDAEWVRRAVKKGAKLVYVDKACVYHPARRSLTEVFRRSKRVAGGQYSLHKHRGAGFFLKFLIPPVYKWKRLAGNEDLNILEKGAAFFLAYLVKLYQFGVLVSLKFGFSSPARS